MCPLAWKIRLACENNDDLFELVINAVKHRCTLGEIISTMKEVFGTYMAPTDLGDYMSIRFDHIGIA